MEPFTQACPGGSAFVLRRGGSNLCAIAINCIDGEEEPGGNEKAAASRLEQHAFRLSAEKTPAVVHPGHRDRSRSRSGNARLLESQCNIALIDKIKSPQVGGAQAREHDVRHLDSVCITFTNKNGKLVVNEVKEPRCTFMVFRPFADRQFSPVLLQRNHERMPTVSETEKAAVCCARILIGRRLPGGGLFGLKREKVPPEHGKCFRLHGAATNISERCGLLLAGETENLL